MSLLSNLKPGVTGLDQLRTLLAAGRQPSIHEALDIALIAADEGTVVVDAHNRATGISIRQARLAAAT